MVEKQEAATVSASPGGNVEVDLEAGVSADRGGAAIRADPPQPRAKKNGADGHDKATHLPVLIVPGFMSSGLEVKESAVSDDWVGERVWLNLQRLGLKSIQRGGALRSGSSQEPKTKNEEVAKEEAEGDEGGGQSRLKQERPQVPRSFSVALRQREERDLDCKSDWLQHISLSSDMRSERPGMKVRPIEGLRGVDYLGQHDRQVLVQQLINSCSYVFGPVIDALKKAGYTDRNLNAAPYDWRVPPSLLEERDQYFTRTMRKVERLYNDNDGTPVVLVCHSLGCRMAHYFLNFAKNHSSGGQKWLDRYIHTYMPVGAPHLGAPKSLRAMVDGDKMGLDAFLSDEEGLVFGRSLGSGVWLLPTELPERNAPPCAIMRNEGAIRVTVTSPVACRELLRDWAEKEGEIPKVRMQIKFGGKSLTTAFRQPVGDDDMTATFPERFMFPAPPSLPLTSAGGSDEFQIILLEPGLDKAAKSARRAFWDSWICRPVVAAFELVFMVLKFVLFGGYLCLRRVFKGSPEEKLPSAQDITDVAVDTGTKLAATKLATSETLHLQEVLAGQNEADFQVDVSSTKSNKTLVDIKVEWVPPAIGEKEFGGCSSISKLVTPPNQMAKHGLKGDGCPVSNVKKKNKHVQYEPVNGDGLLRREGMSYVFDLIRDSYDSDPLGPRSMSSKSAPPVRRVKAIYGVNLLTEVSAVYRRSCMFLEDGRLQKMHDLDMTAGMEFLKKEYKMQRGVIMETRNSPQFVLGPPSSDVGFVGESSSVKLSSEIDGSSAGAGTAKQLSPKGVLGDSTQGSGAVLEKPSVGELVHRSGDGTVPYWSLQHCRTWHGPRCNVSVDEIEGAEHREILGNVTFHKILVEYVTRGSVEFKSSTLGSVMK